jgi:hypothetical protein
MRSRGIQKTVCTLANFVEFPNIFPCISHESGSHGYWWQEAMVVHMDVLKSNNIAWIMLSMSNQTFVVDSLSAACQT